MSDRVGPFLVPNDQGGLSLIHAGETVPLDHNTTELWFWNTCQYMKRWAEEQRRNDKRD